MYFQIPGLKVQAKGSHRTVGRKQIGWVVAASLRVAQDAGRGIVQATADLPPKYDDRSCKAGPLAGLAAARCRFHVDHILGDNCRQERWTLRGQSRSEARAVIVRRTNRRQQRHRTCGLLEAGIQTASLYRTFPPRNLVHIFAPRTFLISLYTYLLFSRKSCTLYIIPEIPSDPNPNLFRQS
ncbi:hypothetical protein OBBRIDRAFT_640955 [Obba rivulosa]|uniref:Uncharacterized protein n=1 Tax=Obba rivulosa TaxID=1052685 RepID=A0A8E2DSV5_9APHY|nr:hypothetical protein OBBRIDRAFT_640955 [Obba rivulosa]